MKYILALSLIFLAACKDNEIENEEPEACQGDANYSSLAGNWRYDENAFVFGQAMPHVVRLKFITSTETLRVTYSCSDPYGNEARPVKVDVDYAVDFETGQLEIARTGDMEPQIFNSSYDCATLNFGGRFEFELAGSCLVLDSNRNEPMYFKKGI